MSGLEFVSDSNHNFPTPALELVFVTVYGLLNKGGEFEVVIETKGGTKNMHTGNVDM